QCNCYCCPSKDNSYGVLEGCKQDKPDFAGSFAIGSPASCSSIACHVNYPTMCPPPPIRSRSLNGGAMRWGCKIGCRFGPDGFTVVNETARAPGIDGLDDAASSKSVRSGFRFCGGVLLAIFV
ncbi:hypothetical protein BC831DRAFT_400358, partial [Entophlyctis helioformis]